MLPFRNGMKLVRQLIAYHWIQAPHRTRRIRPDPLTGPLRSRQ
jgi:hypothetical protein